MRNDYQLQSAISRNTNDLTVDNLIDIIRSIEAVLDLVKEENSITWELFDWKWKLLHIVYEHITVEELAYLEKNK